MESTSDTTTDEHCRLCYKRPQPPAVCKVAGGCSLPHTCPVAKLGKSCQASSGSSEKKQFSFLEMKKKTNVFPEYDDRHVTCRPFLAEVTDHLNTWLWQVTTYLFMNYTSPCSGNLIFSTWVEERNFNTFLPELNDSCMASGNPTTTIAVLKVVK